MANNSVKRTEITALVVEDNIPNMNYILLLLKKFKISAIQAYSGEDALQVINNRHIDIMFLDINLGVGMSGIDLLKKLREKKEYQDTPAVAVTAYYGDDKGKEFLDYSFDLYLAKPFNQDQLKDVLNMYVKLEA